MIRLGVASAPRSILRTAANAGSRPAFCESGRVMMQSPTAANLKPSATRPSKVPSSDRLGSKSLGSLTPGSEGFSRVPGGLCASAEQHKRAHNSNPEMNADDEGDDGRRVFAKAPIVSPPVVMAASWSRQRPDVESIATSWRRILISADAVRLTGRISCCPRITTHCGAGNPPAGS